MERRSFIRMMTAFGLSPALPTPVITPSSAAHPSLIYNRFQYGLGVFHARTRASLTASELAAKLSIPNAQAEQMMHQMLKEGVIKPMTGSASAFRAVSQNIQAEYQKAKSLVSKVNETMDRLDEISQDAAPRSSDETIAPQADDGFEQINEDQNEA